MNHEQISELLREHGLCGATDGERACIQEPGHDNSMHDDHEILAARIKALTKRNAELNETASAALKAFNDQIEVIKRKDELLKSTIATCERLRAELLRSEPLNKCMECLTVSPRAPNCKCNGWVCGNCCDCGAAIELQRYVITHTVQSDQQYSAGLHENPQSAYDCMCAHRERLKRQGMNIVASKVEPAED